MSGPAVRPLDGAGGAGALRAQWLAARVAAGLSLLAAWMHLAYLESHWQQWWGYGAFFLAAGAGQAIFAVVILHSPRTWVAAAGIAGNLAIVTLYVLTRTAGVPAGPHAHVVEPATAIDLACTAAEIGVIGALVVLLAPRARRLVLDAVLVEGLVLWALRLTGRLP